MLKTKRNKPQISKFLKKSQKIPILSPKKANSRGQKPSWDQPDSCNFKVALLWTTQNLWLYLPEYWPGVRFFFRFFSANFRISGWFKLILVDLDELRYIRYENNDGFSLRKLLHPHNWAWKCIFIISKLIFFFLTKIWVQTHFWRWIRNQHKILYKLDVLKKIKKNNFLGQQTPLHGPKKCKSLRIKFWQIQSVF